MMIKYIIIHYNLEGSKVLKSYIIVKLTIDGYTLRLGSHNAFCRCDHNMLWLCTDSFIQFRNSVKSGPDNVFYI